MCQHMLADYKPWKPQQEPWEKLCCSGLRRDVKGMSKEMEAVTSEGFSKSIAVK